MRDLKQKVLRLALLLWPLAERIENAIIAAVLGQWESFWVSLGVAAVYGLVAILAFRLLKQPDTAKDDDAKSKQSEKTVKTKHDSRSASGGSGASQGDNHEAHDCGS